MFPVIDGSPQEEDDDLGNHITCPIFHSQLTSNVLGGGRLNLKYDPDAGEKPILLLSGGAASSGTAAVSLHLAETGANAQVPAGKKWKGFIVLGGGTANAVKGKVRSAATLDTADGTVVWDGSAGTNLTNQVFQTTELLEFDENEYPTIEYSSGTGTIEIKMVVLIEVDA